MRERHRNSLFTLPLRTKRCLVFATLLGPAACDPSEPEVAFVAGTRREQCDPIGTSDILSTAPYRVDFSHASWILGTENMPLNQVVGAGFLPSGDVVLLSDFGRTLEVFDGLSGSRVTRIGRSGRGPGEFLQAFAVNIFPDGRLAVPDYQNGRVVYFTGGFAPGPVVSAPAASPASTLAVLLGGTEDGAIVMTLQTKGEQRTLNSGVLIEEVVDHHVIFRPSSSQDTLFTGWFYRATLNGFLASGPPSRPSRGAWISAGDVGWLEADGLSLSLYNSQSGAVSCIEWRGPVPAREARPERPSLAPLDAYSPEVRLQNDARYSDIFAALREHDLGPFHPPVLRDMRLALDGSMIVHLGVELRDTPPALKEYVRLSREGKVLHRLQLPSGNNASVLAISDAHMLVAWRGQFDVEYVGLFPLPS